MSDIEKADIEKGIEEAAAGELEDRGSFAQFVEDDTPDKDNPA